MGWGVLGGALLVGEGGRDVNAGGVLDIAALVIAGASSAGDQNQGAEGRPSCVDDGRREAGHGVRHVVWQAGEVGGR